MVKMRRFFLRMKLEPNPFICSGDVYETVHSRNDCPLIRQFNNTVMMVKVQLFAGFGQPFAFKNGTFRQFTAGFKC